MTSSHPGYLPEPLYKSHPAADGDGVWCHRPIIPAFRRLGQGDQEYKGSLGYSVSECVLREPGLYRKVLPQKVKIKRIIWG